MITKLSNDIFLSLASLSLFLHLHSLVICFETVICV